MGSMRPGGGGFSRSDVSETGLAGRGSQSAANAAQPPPAPARAAVGGREFWLVFVGAIFAEMLLPIVGKYQSSDASGSMLAQFVWSVMYASAAIRLFALKVTARELISRSLSLWVFVGLMLVSVIWSVSPRTTFVNAIELIGTTIVGAYLVARFTVPELLKLIALTFCAIAFLSLAFVFGAPGHGRMNFGSGAWSGIYQDKNNLGRAMALAIMSLVVLLAESAHRRRLFLAVAATLAACVALLAGSGSATAFGDCAIVVAAGLAGMACKSTKFGLVARIVTAIAGVSAAIAVLVFGFTPDAIFAALGRDASLTGRTDFWPYLQQAISERPILGYGYDAFFGSPVGDNFLSAYVAEAGGFSPYHAHNSFLQISLDSGYVGVATLIFVLVLSIWRGLAYLLREPGRFAVWPLMIVSYLILGSFTETYFGNYNSIEWILFTAALLYPVSRRPGRPA